MDSANFTHTFWGSHVSFTTLVDDFGNVVHRTDYRTIYPFCVFMLENGEALYGHGQYA